MTILTDAQMNMLEGILETLQAKQESIEAKMQAIDDRANEHMRCYTDREQERYDELEEAKDHVDEWCDTLQTLYDDIDWYQTFS